MISLSIITISRDFDVNFYKTLNSISQLVCFPGIELIWIIGNANSTINKKQLNFMVEKANIKILKGRDTGIFDAMNKGLSLAVNEFVWFLNSGDIAITKGLKKLIDKDYNSNLDYYSFGVINKYKDLSYKRISTKKSPTHQGFICRRIILEKVLFDTTYPLSADHKLMRFIITRFKGEFVNEFLAEFNNYGISSLPSLTNLRRAKNENINYKLKFLFKILLIKIIGNYRFIIFINEVKNKRKRI